jgi:type II secretory pathway pseudopilin PulG
MITFHQRKFFTLLELLSVIGIIAIVAGIILGGMSYAGRRADQAKTIALMTQLEMALDAFKQDRGYYPPAAGAFVKFLTKSNFMYIELEEEYQFFNSSTNRPYLELGWVTDTAKTYVDGYGNAFQYRCPGTNNTSFYDLWSEGATSAVDDDICNWKRN